MPSQDRQKDLKGQVAALRRELSDLKAKVERMEDDLVPVRKLASQENSLPDSYTGLKRWMERHSIPLRTKTGHPKPQGSKEASYVSLKEVRAEEADTTRAVR
jgi:hypothetical protein